MDTSRPCFLSVVIPVYQAADMLPELVGRLVRSLTPITPAFEIILVDDRSPDSSWSAIQEQARLEPRVRGLRLSRNFGQHRAITAGLDDSQGEWVVVMDCDLQDRPEEIPALLAKAQEGFDMVLARRLNRQDNLLKKLSSDLFYRLLGYLTDTRQDSSVANFGIYHRKVIAAICVMRESARYFPTMAKWVGFTIGTLPVEHANRATGTSSYTFRRRAALALDIILSYSDKPLRLTVKFGALISVSSFLGAIYMLVRAIEGKIQVLGYASLIVSIWFFSGFLILIMGIIGLYLGKTFEGVKNRPLYLVDELTGPREGLPAPANKP